ncbi:hypothetical protein EDB85DRAFT_1888049 [Lactarius pseudohatsudake]|nr:hypothetical protein EDB85DRAFT_1888049 [Lactarius pseudohatsudake]
MTKRQAHTPGLGAKAQEREVSSHISHKSRSASHAIGWSGHKLIQTLLDKSRQVMCQGHVTAIFHSSYSDEGLTLQYVWSPFFSQSNNSSLVVTLYAWLSSLRGYSGGLNATPRDPSEQFGY